MGETTRSLEYVVGFWQGKSADTMIKGPKDSYQCKCGYLNVYRPLSESAVTQ